MELGDWGLELGSVSPQESGVGLAAAHVVTTESEEEQVRHAGKEKS